jgi:hypothetical protein
MPDATPERFWSASLSTVAVSGATVTASPRPKRLIAGSSSVR